MWECHVGNGGTDGVDWQAVKAAAYSGVMALSRRSSDVG